MSKDITGKRRILYVQIAPSTGGASINVFYPMVAGLDRDRFEPLVLFYWPDPYYSGRFEALEVQAMVFEKPRPWKHPAPVAQLQENSLVKSLQKGNGKSSSLYHALGSYVRLGYYVPQILRLAKLIKVNDVDLVHLTRDPAGHGREVVLAAKLAGVPVVCYAQNFTEFQAVDRQIARLIDGYVSCSNAIGEHCRRLGGAVPGKSHTIYAGVADGGKWSQEHDASQVRGEFGWSDDDFIVGNVARLVRWKGQDVFLHALAEAKREVPDIRGLVVGSEKLVEGQQQSFSYYEELLNLRESLNLTDNVHFAGFRGDIPRILASIDVLVHSSSKPEPFATAVIEGMMAGCPVIAINDGGMPEMIEDGVTGLLVPMNDSQAMAEAILACYRDRAHARRMTVAAQHRARTELTAQCNIEQFQTLYQTLLAG